MKLTETQRAILAGALDYSDGGPYAQHAYLTTCILKRHMAELVEIGAIAFDEYDRLVVTPDARAAVLPLTLEDPERFSRMIHEMLDVDAREAWVTPRTHSPVRDPREYL